MKNTLICLILILTSCDTLYSKNIFIEKSKHASFKVEKILNIKSTIWGFDFLSDDTIILSLINGKIKTYNFKNKLLSSIQGVPNVSVGGQGGLLDLKVYEDKNQKQWVYFCYSTKDKNGKSTAIAKGYLKNKQLIEVKTIFIAKPFVSTSHHFGCRIAFDDNDHLFLSVGDRGHRDDAQKLTSHNGKILRLDLQGRPAIGNPFANNKEAKPEIWSYGHRNPQGLYFDKKTKTLWEQEHGPKGGDEINQIKKGLNYGWPIITYGKEYSGFKVGKDLKQKVGMQQALYYYVPSIAPSGLTQYRGKKLSFWSGDLFSGALALRHLNRIRIRDGKIIEEERLLKKLNKRIRHVSLGPDEKLYFSTDSGDLYRIDRTK